MPVTIGSFAKINLGLRIGGLRPDGFHDLRTIYQTIALHDVIRVEVQRGKMVAELKPSGHDKGRAIEAFMREKPFAGRVPVFLGDDLTDEHGFRVVDRMGGHAIKVGPGATAARWRLPNPSAARRWLDEWLDVLARAA